MRVRARRRSARLGRVVRAVRRTLWSVLEGCWLDWRESSVRCSRWKVAVGETREGRRVGMGFMCFGSAVERYSDLRGALACRLEGLILTYGLGNIH